MSQRAHRSAIALLVSLALLLFGLVAPAEAGSGSRSVHGCHWSGSNGYAGAPFWVGYGTTTSNCSHVEVRVRASVNGSWITSTRHGYNGTITRTMGSMEHLSYTDHNVHIGNVAWGFRVFP